MVIAFTNVQTPLNAQALATLAPTLNAKTDVPGASVQFDFLLTNNQTVQDTFTITTSNPTLPSSYQVLILSQSVIVNGNGGTATVSIIVTIPTGRPAETNDIIVKADAGGGITTSAIARLTVNGPTATPTSTPTTPTATVGPTATPGPACPEAKDPGSDAGNADQLLVDVSEKHGICTAGDEDWFKFGAVGGKVYTIDIPQMDAGLDLSLELFDANGNRLTFNDDYFNRTPGSPNPKDIKPRIQSWRAPDNGTYYIRVRDTLNIGGADTTYTIVVLSESYGPTPATVTELCRDLFEEDGLPEQARLITSNETQVDHVLCPTGDADWVKFFGLRGKTYYIYTDTRNKGAGAQPNTEAGADTVIYLADRDGVSIIDFNDDLGRDGTSQGLNDQTAPSLDSALRFEPSADGFYYLQVKNVGDIGNQFIKYNLTLKLCLPGQECRRDSTAPTQPTSGLPTPTGTFTANTPTTTPTPTVTPTGNTNNFLQNSLKPGPMVNGPLRGFADPSFDRVWQRTDRPIAEQRVARSWLWGPHGLMARTEGYIQSASGLRQVQYFDKARMEVNNPRGDRNSRWFVTTGLLVVELISGRTQIGDSEFVQHAPADIAIAGDTNDPNAPTYASFGGVSGLQPGDRTGQIPAESLNRAGQVGGYAGPQRPETQLAHFVPESGHNIPQVFWDYLNSGGLVYENNRYRSSTLVDWVFTLGHPISEPYWVRISVGGRARDVLVQAFERRVLTYSPDNPSGWQVEMGNVGRHYYFWRYGEELPS
ncbi:MAG: PPC domain-containing protein [Kouleothrix sp.]|nr:PPC domain-containing protein [Kouleothrix sp.]